MWDGANQIQCDDFHPESGDWTRSCQNLKAVAGHVPEVLRTYIPPEGNSHFFSLYRSEKYPEGDTFIAAAMGDAQESIDMIHVNFSLEVQCMLNLVVPNLCTFDNALPWMEAIVQAVETNQVHVRAVVENTNSNGLENRIGVQVLMDELARRGYDGYVEIRFYNGKLHAKSMLIDDQLLIIGSQNMRYSSWGDGKGLAEHSLATSDPDAIADYQRLFEVKWADAIPFDEAEYGTSP
jgi:phosphatidylserine/phosphatidylglycerophosphate/cardiolipin synthase-like enzyme